MQRSRGIGRKGDLPEFVFIDITEKVKKVYVFNQNRRKILCFASCPDKFECLHKFLYMLRPVLKLFREPGDRGNKMRKILCEGVVGSWRKRLWDREGRGCGIVEEETVGSWRKGLWDRERRNCGIVEEAESINSLS